MVASGWQLNRFERILFRVALLVAALAVALRLGSLLFLSYFHYGH